MPYNEPTVPMAASQEAPTWPSAPIPPRAGSPGRPIIYQRPPTAARGCGLGLAVIVAFLGGAVLATIITALLVAPRPLPPATIDHTIPALKITLTDNFLTEGLNASDAGGLLDGIQTHIQRDGQLTVSGSLRGVAVGSGQTATFVFAPTVSKGRLTVEAISGSVGALPVPIPALSRIADALNTQLAKSSAIQLGGGQQLTAQGITFSDGQMTISYA